MNKYKEKFKDADKSFENRYKEALSQLKALTDDELAIIVPTTNDKEVYNELIAIIEDATKKNFTQAQFIAKVKQLGQTGKRIIQRITTQKPDVGELLKDDNDSERRFM